MGLRPLEIFLLLQCGDRLKSSESDVYRRHILTTNVYPRAVRVKGYMPVVAFLHRLHVHFQSGVIIVFILCFTQTRFIHV